MHVKPSEGFLSKCVIKGQITSLEANSEYLKSQNKFHSKLNSIVKCFDKKVKSITKEGRSILPEFVSRKKFKIFNSEKRTHTEIYENEYDTIELKKFSIDRKERNKEFFLLDSDSFNTDSDHIYRDVSTF